MLSEIGLGPKQNAVTEVTVEALKAASSHSGTKVADLPKHRTRANKQAEQPETKVAALRQFDLCEKEARDNWGNLLRVGRALAKIREMFNEPKTASSLKAAFGSWHRCCKNRWKKTKQAINLLIAEAKIATHLKLDDNFPATRLRPLIGLTPEQQAEAWKAAVSMTKQSFPSAAQIKVAACQFKEAPVMPPWTLRSAQTDFMRDLQRALARACRGASADQAQEFRRGVPDLLEHSMIMTDIAARPENYEGSDLAVRVTTKAKPATVVNTVAEAEPKSEERSDPKTRKEAQHNAVLAAPVPRPCPTKRLGTDGAVKAKALTDYRRGDLLKVIAARYDVSETSISLWAKEAGEPRRKRGCRVKNCPSERDIEIVTALKAAKDGQPTQAEIAKRYHMTRANVHRI